MEFDEYFGLTDQDVKKMLEYYELEKHYDTIKEWYNGYQFGKTSVYCPWDVISYCKNLRADSQSLPEDYWSNTSSNSIVRRMLEKANKQTKDEIEQLIAGEGYSDILVEVPESRTGIVIEIKYAEENQLDIGCKIALEQIEEKQYATKLHNDGMQEIVKYGIACYKKYCKVVMGERL